ncbi:hypothetical protein EH165_15185 [Nakamurella antarctica]|uniref:Uncharacterized protein n=1 Tax=Nakamurella antarctica TaxID=1902245 RepID=A0A3G8ZPL8_9ACTN|nr:hypothetical protein [Nakamurella antarctica]AZI59282.1 hypothetical protein EH165_15185 [Nakamurella antarctica]
MADKLLPCGPHTYVAADLIALNTAPSEDIKGRSQHLQVAPRDVSLPLTARGRGVGRTPGTASSQDSETPDSNLSDNRQHIAKILIVPDAVFHVKHNQI